MRALNVYPIGLWSLYRFTICLGFRHDDTLCTMWTLYDLSAIRLIDGHGVPAPFPGTVKKSLLRILSFDIPLDYTITFGKTMI